MAPSTPAAMQSILQRTSSWAPLSTDSRKPSRSHLKTTHHVPGPATSRHPVSGLSITSPGPAKEALLDLLDMAIPVLDLLGMEAVAFALRAVGLVSTAQVTFPPRVFSHLITSQALALAFAAGLLSENSRCL